VILDGSCKTKPDIEYPCEWGFKIIGTNKEKLAICIAEVMQKREHKIRAGNSSSKGKFHSMNAYCEVLSENDRNSIFKTFQEHIDVRIVI